MMSTKPTKTASGGMREAKQKLAQAEKYLQTAKAETGKDSASLQVAATNAIFAGIAASDAACCAKLGKYSRSQNHRDAAKLLASIELGGRNASKDFELLVGKKDEANYGFNISATELKTLVRKAEGLVTFAHKSIFF
jgi:hypothetical protein